MTTPQSRVSRVIKSFAFAGVLTVASLATADSASAGFLNFLFGDGGQPSRSYRDVSSRQQVAFPSRYGTGTIVVSFADRKLYFVTKPGQAYSYSIGTPVAAERWSGVLKVSSKQTHPRWVPTPQMRRKDPSLPMAVPGGHPRNPLGPRALYLGDTLYRIHGTDAPWTIGHEVSNGCVRLYNSDILDLYPRVPVGATVIVTWDRFQSVAQSPSRSRERHADNWRQSAFR